MNHKAYDVRDLNHYKRSKLLEKLRLDGVANGPDPTWLGDESIEVIVCDLRRGRVQWAHYKWATEQEYIEMYKPNVTIEYRFSFDKVDTAPREIVVKGRTYRLVD